MTKDRLESSIFKALAKAVVLAVILVMFWGFLHKILEVSLIFILAGIAAIALTPVVNWLEHRKVPRGLATVLVLISLVAFIVGLLSFIVPRLREQINLIAKEVPSYGQQISERVREQVKGYPPIAKQLDDPNLLGRFSPTTSEFLGRLGHYSVSFFTVVIGSLVLFTLVAYMLAMPRPLIRGLLQAVPAGHRAQFQEALVRGCDMIVSWVWANAIIGACDAVIASIALSVIGVPGALVWGAFTLFAELVPQLGAYLMAIPPTIVAFAKDPMMALYVIVFYILLQQLVNHVLAPMIRARTMRIHPISEIFAVLALTLAFGIIGAIIADPVLGFAKAFYDAYYGKGNDSPELDADVEEVLHRKLPAPATD